MLNAKSKVVMTSFDIAAILSELQDVIVGSRINNIYQVSPVTFLLTFTSDVQLLIELGRRIHLTRYTVKRPPQPSQFCKILRKYLRRGIIQDLKMPRFERIIILIIEARKTTYRLYVELFSKGNAILVDDQDTIMYASSYRTMRDRDITRHQPFRLPPARGMDPTQVTEEGMTLLLDQKGTLIRALTRTLSIGGLYAEELLLRANLDKNMTLDNITSQDLNKLHSALTQLIIELKKHPHPHIVEVKSGQAIDVLPIKLHIYTPYNRTCFKSFNEAADTYFTDFAYQKDAADSIDRDETKQHIEEQHRILSQQQESLTTFNQTAEQNTKIGDLIYTYIQNLEQLRLTAVTILSDKREPDKIDAIKTAAAFLSSPLTIANIDLAIPCIYITVNEFEIQLLLKKTIYDNASRYYNEAKRIREKIAGVITSIADTQHTIKRLQSEGTDSISPPSLTPPRIQRKRRWYEKFHWAYSRDGFLLLGGRDATTNELLIKRHTSSNDLVFHADIVGAPFVVLKTNGKMPSNSTLEETAQLAVTYSKAWQSGYASLNAYWVKPNQVSKEAPSGEYLTRGAFVIRGKKTYLRNIPMRLAIGACRIEQYWQIIGGPPTAIAAHTPYFVAIIPGRQKSGHIAKIIRHKLSTLVPTEIQPFIRRIPIERIQHFLPAGGSDLTEITIKAT
jgi:predicted ribosome quality control (RQC) complex YloA/Tae2 family protein